MRRINWAIWLGFLLSIFAFLSFPLIFVNWPITRDFPWANLCLFALALLFLFVGIRRAFAPDRRRLTKVVASVITTVSVLMLGMFIFVAFVASRWLPPSTAAPQVGQKAPEFRLADTGNQPVSLTELLSRPINDRPPKGVLLIFYRGYW